MGRVIVMVELDEIAGRFFRRAEELRSIASNVQDANSRDAMLRWADDYVRLAERAIELSNFAPRRSGENAPAQPQRAEG